MTTAPVYLAPLFPEESSRVFQWINHRDLQLYNGAFRPVTHARHQEWFEAMSRKADALVLGIHLAEPERLIGCCQLLSIHPVHRHAELRIRLGEPDLLGKGYGTAALRLLLQIGFRDLNLERVYLFVRSDNARALRSYQKVGFQLEGTLRRHGFIDGAYRDILAMGLLREEFAQPQAPALPGPEEAEPGVCSR